MLVPQPSLKNTPLLREWDTLSGASAVSLGNRSRFQSAMSPLAEARFLTIERQGNTACYP